MTHATDTPLIVNERNYAVPVQPIVVICLDGCEPEYLEDDKVVIIRATMNIQYRYSLI